MAGDEEAFLAALKSEPDDSDPREVYADWLEEHGKSERAEYVRLEAEVRAFDFITGNPEREEKKARRDELEETLAKSDAKWLADVRRVARAPTKHPRPTSIGRAEPIPARPAPETEVGTALPTVIPELRPSRARGRFIVELVLGLAIALLIKDMTTKGFLLRLIEGIYARGHF